MSREIKFRVWDKGYRVMINGVIVGTQMLNEFFQRDDYEFSQYTGRKDKDEVEIYENDLVRYNTGEVWAVEWSTRLSAFIYVNRLDKRLSSHEQTMDMHGVKVIGNIFENPELLSH